jgi:hypothetical protein
MLYLTASNAQAIGFKSGNSFSTQPFRGEFYLHCDVQDPTIPVVQHVFCEDNFLSPAMTDYFVGPENVAADKVVLEARNGRYIIRKNSKYNTATEQSTSRFNLWILSLTQKPLLNEGQNIISYQMSKAGRAIVQGEFEVLVTSKSLLTCPVIDFFQRDPILCKNTTLLCNDYFVNQDDCK